MLIAGLILYPMKIVKSHQYFVKKCQIENYRLKGSDERTENDSISFNAEY